MQFSAATILAVASGGALGSLARYFIGRVEMIFASYLGSFFFVSGMASLSTLLINCVGGFLIGISYVFFFPALNPEKSQFFWNFLGIGFLGGFTTFSTFSLISYQMLLKKGEIATVLYMFMSAAISVGACVLGIMLARRLLLL